MRKLFILSSTFLFSLSYQAQTAYDIRFNIKNSKDETMYLAKYYFDQTTIVDSCKNIKNGAVQFKGMYALDKGMYILASQEKGRLLDFLVNDTQKFTITADRDNMITSLKSSEKENEQLFSYAKFMTQKDKEFREYQTTLKGKKDSAKLAQQKAQTLSEDIKKFESDFMQRNKGNFVHDFINLKSEKYPAEVPNAANGRPDSVYQYYWYKNHFWDGVNFKDERIMYTPFFAERFKRYFTQLIPQHPDSIIKEIDKVMVQAQEGSLLFNTMLGFFAYKYETDKSMSFDGDGNCITMEKVFIHLADKYITNGKTNGYYSDETVEKIRARVDILRNLLPDTKAANLYMIDTINSSRVLKMGFDTAKTSESVTYLYEKNRSKLEPLYKTLYDVKAKYTILVFWAVDCGHCKTELPKLNDTLNVLRGKVDVKVYAVQTKENLTSDWKKFIVEQKLNDFIHVFDPMHLNNTTEKYDINATPVIYLLDKNKRIKAKRLSPSQTVEIIETLEKIEKQTVK
ncbi:MAG: DUF5106 domain-containing protein [Bacteroidetes bacterium]|nr:DUF5106 domain-containing protein [Bacteroidota bacterium]